MSSIYHVDLCRAAVHKSESFLSSLTNWFNDNTCACTIPFTSPYQVGYLHDWERNVAASKGKTRAQVDYELYGSHSSGNGDGEGEGSNSTNSGTNSKWAWNSRTAAAAAPNSPRPAEASSSSPSSPRSSSMLLSGPSSPGGWGNTPNAGRYVPGTYNQVLQYCSSTNNRGAFRKSASKSVHLLNSTSRCLLLSPLLRHHLR